MSRFFGDNQGQQHSAPQPPVEENLVEDTNENLSKDGISNGGSNSHEVSDEGKQWKPLSFSEEEPSMRKKHQTVLVEGSKVDGHEEDEDASKDDFLADWSHELATK